MVGGAMNLPAILSLDFTKAQYQKGSINLERLNKLAATNGAVPGSAGEKVVIRLNSLAIALRALNADSIADELIDIANEVKKMQLPVQTSAARAALRESLSKLPPVSRRA
jgi:hypothetical protein